MLLLSQEYRETKNENKKHVITEVAQQAVTEMTKSWRAKGESHGIPHRSDHHSSRRNQPHQSR